MKDKRYGRRDTMTQPGCDSHRRARSPDVVGGRTVVSDGRHVLGAVGALLVDAIEALIDKD